MATATEMITLPYVQVPETSEPLYWADLVALDLFKFDRPGGKQELARELSKAIQRIGFYVVNHGISKEDIETQFALASSVLSLEDSEKARYRAALEAGDYNGWKPAGTRELIPGVRDNFEIYNIPKFIPEHASWPHPEVFKSHWETIEHFSRLVHENVVKKLLVIFAIALGLNDEDWIGLDWIGLVYSGYDVFCRDIRTVLCTLPRLSSVITLPYFLAQLRLVIIRKLRRPASPI